MLASLVGPADSGNQPKRGGDRDHLSGEYAELAKRFVQHEGTEELHELALLGQSQGSAQQ